jgi:hypothetical protein
MIGDKWCSNTYENRCQFDGNSLCYLEKYTAFIAEAEKLAPID